MPAASLVEILPVAVRSGATARAHRIVSVLAGLVLVAVTLLTYASDPAVPGNRGRFPAGWWGWWDQSQYLLSARSLARFDLAPAHHWYPLGYALIGAPFTLVSTLHPFLLPDLLCSLVAFVAFLRFARAVGVTEAAAALLFLLATCGSEAIRQVWAEPWNSTLSAALLWSLLALTASHLTRTDIDRRRVPRMLAIGAVAGFVPVARPTDLLPLAIWALGAGALAVRTRRLSAVDLTASASGCALVLLPCTALWIAIHGAGQSDYMRSSAALGFDFGTLGWRGFLLLVTPRPWFPDGSGLFQRLPWLLPGVAGLVASPWLLRGAARSLLLLLGAMIVAYCALFCAYVDLIPPGLWRFHNVHYFKWVLPGLALFGAVLLRRLLCGPRRGAGFAAALCGCVLAALVCDLRLLPRPVSDADPAWMVQLRGPVPGQDESYFGHISIRDDRGELRQIRDFRALPDEQGWRLVGLRRPFEGPMVISGIGHWPDGPVPSAATDPGVHRWGRGIGFRLPWPIGRPAPIP